MLPAARLTRRLASLRIHKHVPEDGLELTEDHRGDLKVSLQPLHPQPEVLRQVGHVGPLPHLGEELDQTGERHSQGRVGVEAGWFYSTGF